MRESKLWKVKYLAPPQGMPAGRVAYTVRVESPSLEILVKLWSSASGKQISSVKAIGTVLVSTQDERGPDGL